MPYTPEQRRHLHTKQSRLQVSPGVPLVNTLKEGVPVLRSTPEGVAEYVKYKGELYNKIYNRVGIVPVKEDIKSSIKSFLENSASISVRNLTVASNNPSIWVQNDTLNQDYSGHIDFTEAKNAFGATGGYGFRLALDGDTPSNTGRLRIQSGNNTTITDRLIIERDSGKVGIGTSSPNTQFEIEGTGDPTLLGQIKGTTMTDTDTIMWRCRGTGNDVEAVSEIGVYYQTASETDAPVGYLRLEAGNGGIAYIWSDDDADLRVSSTKTNIGKDSVGTVIGAQSSDERLKNISSDVFPYGLAEVNQITPIKYSFKSDVNSTNKLGFGAQTIRSIIPESVYDTGECLDGYNCTEDEDGKETFTARSVNMNKLGMQYVQIIPVLVKAIQELSDKVTALENA